MNRYQQSMPFPIILAVDPSVNNLGYACFDANLGQNTYEIGSGAWRYGVIHPRPAREREPQYIWKDAYAKIKEALGYGEWWPTHFACEWPTFFASTRGQIAAMKGHTIGLAGLAGYLAGRLGLPPDRITLWKPEQWKGSVPKHVTRAKFLRLFGPGGGAEAAAEEMTDDAIDAVMIAEHWLNLYHRGMFTWQRRRSSETLPSKTHE